MNGKFTEKEMEQKYEKISTSAQYQKKSKLKLH